MATPGVNFSAYKTYSWVQAAAPAGGNPVMQQEILNDLNAALGQKGYQQVASNGDLSLILTIGARENTEIQSWGRFGLQTSVYQYTEGQLSLDAFDTKTQQAVWHGQASPDHRPGQAESFEGRCSDRQADGAISGNSCRAAGVATATVVLHRADGRNWIEGGAACFNSSSSRRRSATSSPSMVARVVASQSP
jgi:hypothetical protein